MAVFSPQTQIALVRARLQEKMQETKRKRYQNEPVLWIEERAKGYLYAKLKEIAFSVLHNRRTAVPACHEAGKHLALDTPIPTSTGWTTMGEITVGDKVFDETGKSCHVTALTDIEERDTYRIYFSDDTYIDASDTHLWNVLDMNHRRRNISDWRRYWDDTFVKTTKELFDNQYTNTGQRRWSIPNTKSLSTQNHWLLRWAPYTYGCWLGDGTTTQWQMTCHVGDAKYFALMNDAEILKPKNRDDVRIIIFPGRNSIDCPTNVYKIKEKFIPQEMLRASHEDRLELLRGIMDTDGYLMNNSCVEVDLSVENLAMQVIELIRSLGWIARFTSRIPKCTTTNKEGKRSYRIRFTPDENPFSLPRKAILWEAHYNSSYLMKSRTTKKTIEKIEFIGIRKVRCIEVDSIRRLYLAGRGMIPTHNSWLMARLIGWWIDSHPLGQAFVVTTAPTNKQVKAVLWKEIRRVWKTANLPGRMNQTEWWINGEMVAMGRKPSDYDPTAFQGIHAKWMLLIIDEGCGVPEQIYIAGNSLAANEFSRIVVIGNPDDADSHFAKVCEPGSGWNVIPISAFDTPNFTGEDAPIEVKENLVSHIYVEEMKRDVGEDSGVYVSKVLGRFPINKIDGVIPLSWIRQCQDDDVEYSNDMLLPVELGVDVGAGGDDTSIRVRHGILAGESLSLTTPEAEEAYAAIVEMIVRNNATRVKIDVIGLGWGLIGMLRQTILRGRHYNEILEEEVDISFCEVVGVNVGQAATDPTRFPRLRDQLWWEVGRELSRTKGWDLRNVDDVTVGQLIRPTWRPDLANRHKIESKEDTMKRTHTKSPNEADALLLAFCEPPVEDERELAIYHEPVTIGPDI